MLAGARDLREGLAVQRRVVGAVVLREMQTRYGSSTIGYLWAVLEPLIFLGAFLVAFLVIGRSVPAGMEPVPFLATGIITFFAFRNTTNQLANAVEGNRGLLVYPQVTPLDLMAARGLLEAATFLIVFGVIIGGAILLGYAQPPAEPLRVLLGLLLISVLAVALGLAQSALIMLVPAFGRLQRPFWRVMLFTSCVFYTLEELPRAAQDIIVYNPVAHVIETLRSGYFASYESSRVDLLYVGAWLIGASFFGLLIERMYRDRKRAK